MSRGFRLHGSFGAMISDVLLRVIWEFSLPTRPFTSCPQLLAIDLRKRLLLPNLMIVTALRTDRVELRTRTLMLALSRFVLLLDLLRTECIWIVRIRPLVVAIRVRVERTAKEDIELTFPTSLCFTLDYMALGTTDVSGNPSTDGTMMEC